MIVQDFFDESTNTFTYVVYKPGTNEAIVIDPVWDFDQASGKLSRESFGKLTNYFKDRDIKPVLVLETHAHADHLSGAQLIKEAYPDCVVGISSRIGVVKDVFSGAFHLNDKYAVGNEAFDLLLNDFQQIDYAGLRVKVLPTPGHTPACSSYLIGDSVFTGDALFAPEQGTGRCDFPKGSATDLFESIHEQLFSLPDTTKVYVGHDYPGHERELRCCSTIKEQKESNIQIAEKITKDSFISARQERDRTLSAPKLLYPSIQVNIRGGRLPPPETNGVSYLKTPLKNDE